MITAVDEQISCMYNLERLSPSAPCIPQYVLYQHHTHYIIISTRTKEKAYENNH